MTGRKHQILELMTLVNKNVIYTHRTEIYYVIGTLVNVELHLVKLCRKIFLTLFQTRKHTLGNTMTLQT